jgi:hypothetical protein
VNIPKPGGGERPLGIPTIRDRVLQTAAKLVWEPIFEADFDPNAYGYRPKRSAQDAIRKVDELLKRGYTAHQPTLSNRRAALVAQRRPVFFDPTVDDPNFPTQLAADTCARCGLRGQHADARACIGALRDRRSRALKTASHRLPLASNR